MPNTHDPLDLKTSLVQTGVPSRIDQMAHELRSALGKTSREDIARLAGFVASDAGSAVLRRAKGILELAGTLAQGVIKETGGVLGAHRSGTLREHAQHRMTAATGGLKTALQNGQTAFVSLCDELKRSPVEAAPRLLVLVLASVAASGGVDGDGGVPDMDIPMMGIGAHRSLLTHSIIVGSALETSILLLARVVILTHKNLPPNHDPLWNGIAHHSVEILKATGTGVSIGIAYHLMVDAFVQPGAYHGVPFEMPIEVHQGIAAVNSVAEATSATSYPNQESIAEATPAVRAEHKKYLAIRMVNTNAVWKLLTKEERAVVQRYGAWMQALATGHIPPFTPKQRRFVEVTNGRRLPVTDHEVAWVALTEANFIVGGATKRVTKS